MRSSLLVGERVSAASRTGAPEPRPISALLFLHAQVPFSVETPAPAAAVSLLWAHTSGGRRTSADCHTLSRSLHNLSRTLATGVMRSFESVEVPGYITAMQRSMQRLSLAFCAGVVCVLFLQVSQHCVAAASSNTVGFNRTRVDVLHTVWVASASYTAPATPAVYRF